MKIRKSVLAWIGIVLCVVVAGIILATPANNLFALLPSALFILCVVMLGKDNNTEADAGKTSNWLVTIALLISVLAAVTTVIVGILFDWWLLIPLAVCILSMPGLFAKMENFLGISVCSLLCYICDLAW